MKLFALIAAVLVTVNAATDKNQWIAFKQTHGKTYKSLLEERTRFGIFQNNLRTIEEHNAKYAKGEETYYMGVNRFADMTAEEFKQMLGLQTGARPTLNATLQVFPEELEAPKFVDWTQEGADLGVKDQGVCGSCWAYSAIGSLEGQNAIHNKVKTPLSEQQLIDCSESYGNGNCAGGGLMTNAFNYIKDKGIEAECSYPYFDKMAACKYDAKKTVLKIKGFKELRASEMQLKKAVGTIGPISVAVSAEHLRLYSGGLITTKCTEPVDHAVLVVGYGTENRKKYWKIKNSWGKYWGEQGYFKLARDARNLCGVASMASYPLL